MREYKVGSKNGDVVIGAKFEGSSGKYTVIDYKNAKNVRIRFDDTGFERVCYAHNVRNGRVKDLLLRDAYSVGFLGGFEYVPSRDRDAYQCWRGMLKRCYSAAKHKEAPTYIGCLVVDEWHNFQNFAKWYYENHPQDGDRYDLDKDIKLGYQKVYSPEHCQFVTRKQNNDELNSRLRLRNRK